MRNTIFVSDNELKLVCANLSGNKLKIKRTLTIPLEPGIIEDGLIKNEEQFIKILSDNKKSMVPLLKNAILVLDSRHTITKKIDIPTLPKKKIDGIVVSEMKELARSYGELVYDYSLFNKNKVLLCCAIPKNVVDDYKKIFLTQGIKISDIDIGINCAIKLTQALKTFTGKTFIINIIHSNNILSLLFENNRYTLSTRLKLNEKRDSAGYINEIYNKLSSIIQFNKAQKSEYEINYSYYCGLTNDELAKLSLLNTYENIQIDNMDSFFVNKSSYKPSDFMFNLCPLCTSKTDINIAKPKSIFGSGEKGKTGGLVVSFATITLVLIASVYYLKVYSEYQELSDSLNKITLYTNDSANKTLYSEAKEIESKLERVNLSLKKMSEFESEISKVAVINSEKFNRIFTAGGDSVSVSALSFVAKDKSLDIEANAVDAPSVSNFVSSLKTTNLFTSVENRGYKVRSDNRLYNFKVACVLKAGDDSE